MSFTLESAMDHLRFTDYTKHSIRTLYNEAHRKYHNQEHVESLLALVDPEFKPLDNLLEAIIFHDIVYSDKLVAPGFNEAASSSLYSMLKATHTDDFDITAVFTTVQAINATAFHDRDQSYLNIVSQTMLDLDLHAFAFPYPDFQKSSQKVREEFEPIVGTLAFVKGQQAFLGKLLARKQIYYVKTEWEDQARENIERMLDALKDEETFLLQQTTTAQVG